MKPRGRHHERKTKHYWSGAGALWILLLLLALLLIKASFLPKVPSYLVVGSPPPPPTVGSRQEMMAIDVDTIKDTAAAPSISKISCNLTNRYSDTCTITEGDLRIHGKSGTIYVVSSSSPPKQLQQEAPNSKTTIKIRPYARKWEQPVMQYVREVTVRPLSSTSNTAIDDGAAGTAPPPPECSVRHDVPAVVFSTGGYNRNFFHVMTDVIVPLYVTARGYDGRVQLLATDYEPKWIAKYAAVLAALSAYPVVDLDSDDAVRCFAAGQVGLESHGELTIDPSLSRHGYSMVTFRDFLRSAYSLPRPEVVPVSRRSSPGRRRKPRLVLVLRRGSRSLSNEAAAVDALTGLGFDVVAAPPETAGNTDQFAAVANSCDVIAGVHGAGLTNMVFLPRNATVVQIIPWGNMKWPCRHVYGDPVPAMGLRYVEYEAGTDETTLNETYSKDHPVFTDPESIHRQGFDKVWAIFLNGQNVTLNITRFRGAMQELYNSITVE